jgi:D-3-phosphoglycerate dehydrogenase
VTRPTILLTFTPAARAQYYRDAALSRLRALGDVRLNETPAPLSGADLVAAAAGCQAIVADRATALDAGVFAACPDLAVALRCAVDIRNIDVAAASAHGVLVTRASAGFANAVAEWVIGALLDLARGTSDSVAAYRRGDTARPTMGRELRGSVLGVIGHGRIGRRVGALGHALGMRVLVSDPLPAASGDGDDVPSERVALDDLLAAADHVVCLAAALPETEKLMDARRFARMKRGAVFINAARGELVDEAALLDALDRGALAGAALDVGRAPDQMPSPELARHPRVVATPHVGGLTPPAVDHQALETVEQLAALCRGEWPPGAVNAAHATRLAALRA